MEWEDGPQKRFGGLYRALKEREEPGYERVYKSEEATFQEEMAFMNWKSDTLNLYKVIDYLEHEWYDDSIIHQKQPPLPFSYHNWLIDPKYKWEDMGRPKDELDLPEKLAEKFINQYKQKKLNSSS